MFELSTPCILNICYNKNMLTEKLECENCLKSPCKELKFDLLRKEWTCSTCINRRLKAEKDTKRNEKN